MAPESSSTSTLIKAASACVWHDGKVLLARRGKTLGKGTWAFPGGRVEPGETALEAAHRELMEETGVTADLRQMIGEFRITTPEAHFHIISFTGFYLSGEAVAASDSDAVAWVAPDELHAYRLSQNIEAAVKRAQILLSL
ncbi:MAG: NUDIX domain-containing protein [Rhizobiales bacterium]|nr:NUDIX domain-containing protein [Hyphomicrobiales bacterium]